MRSLFAVIVLCAIGILAVAVALPYVETMARLKVLSGIAILAMITLCVAFGIFVGRYMPEDSDK